MLKNCQKVVDLLTLLLAIIKLGIVYICMGVYEMEEWSVVLNILFVIVGLTFMLFSLADVNASQNN